VTILSGLVVYLVGWWLVLFMVLPFGVRSHEEANVAMEPGQATGAPVRANILLKFAITTLITSALFAILWIVVEYEIVDFRALLDPPA